MIQADFYIYISQLSPLFILTPRKNISGAAIFLPFKRRFHFFISSGCFQTPTYPSFLFPHLPTSPNMPFYAYLFITAVLIKDLPCKVQQEWNTANMQVSLVRICIKPGISSGVNTPVIADTLLNLGIFFFLLRDSEGSEKGTVHTLYFVKKTDTILHLFHVIGDSSTDSVNGHTAARTPALHWYMIKLDPHPWWTSHEEGWHIQIERVWHDSTHTPNTDVSFNSTLILKLIVVIIR